MTVALTIDSSGLQPLLERASRQHQRELRRVMVRGVERMMTESQREVPRRFGDLATSRFVDVVEARLQITITFGYTAPHAAVTHKGEYVRDGKRIVMKFKLGKKKNYLRDPVRRGRARVIREMRRSLREVR